VVTNAVPHANDIQWLESHAEGLGAYITDISSGMGLATVQGPRSRDLLEKVVNIDLGRLPFFNFAEGQIGNIPVILSRSGYSGELGYELYVGAESAVALWNLIVAEGSEYELLPYGLGALQMHRLEKRYLLYGTDVNTGTNPIEAGLGWTVKFGKGDFVGREALLKVKKEGPSGKLVGFEVEGGTIEARDNVIYHHAEKIGWVTSGNFSPILNANLGIGYVKSELACVGTEFQIEKNGKRMVARVVPTPFYDPKNERLHT
jgi:aminomethyltransferase